MKNLISFFILISIKVFSKIFYRYKIHWPEKEIIWDDIKLIVFLNHTSLFEFLFIGFLPVSFLWKLSKRMIAPGADKTLDRPVVGAFFKLFSPGMTSISRKRDDTWEHFMNSIAANSIILIAPEGRMKRKNGLDLDGNKMTVKPGVVDILSGLNSGQMIVAHSAGLHHVQIPDEGLPRIFKTLEIRLSVFDIKTYTESFNEPIGEKNWRKLVLDDLQQKLEEGFSEPQNKTT